MLWLLTLPAALWPTMGWCTAPAAAIVTFILLGGPPRHPRRPRRIPRNSSRDDRRSALRLSASPAPSCVKRASPIPWRISRPASGGHLKTPGHGSRGRSAWDAGIDELGVQIEESFG